MCKVRGNARTQMGLLTPHRGGQEKRVAPTDSRFLHLNVAVEGGLPAWVSEHGLLLTQHHSEPSL